MRYIEPYIEELIEVKYADEEILTSLLYYKDRLKPKKATQLSAKLKRPFEKNGITVTDAVTYFQNFF